MTAAEIAAALGGRVSLGRMVALPVPSAWQSRCYAGSAGRRAGPIVKCFANCLCDVLDEFGRRGLIGGRTDDARRIEAARHIWDAAWYVCGSAVERYFAGRRTPCCRHHRCARYRSAGTGRRAPACRPWSGAIVDAVGALIGVHRTYLRQNGTGKADAEPAKVMLGRALGGAVRIARPLHETPLIGEGIDIRLAAMQATAARARVELSAGVRQVVILDDDDANGRGKRAARTAARRWPAEGRWVCDALPHEPGTDFNDVLLGRGHAGGARDVTA